MAYLALYRKYRPKNFNEVIGQEYVTQILKNQIVADRIGHAYLLTGIRGTGKTSIAKIFARAMNCTESKDGNPCGKCESCQNIEQAGVMDIIEIDAASNRGVDEIRDIRDKVIYPPKIGRFKVYIIDEVHMLTKEAFNALLKTLEEPPSHVVFILATTEPNKLPATILSRCQRFDIRPISQEMIAGRIEKILQESGVAMELEAIQLIAKRGDHSMRDALSILDQAIDIRHGNESITLNSVLEFLGMTKKEIIIDLINAIIRNDASEVIKIINRLKQKGTDSLQLMNQVIDAIRECIIVKTIGEKSTEVLEKNNTEIEKIREIVSQIQLSRLYQMIELLIEDRQKMRYNDLSSIIMEMALLKLCKKEEKISQKTTEPKEEKPIEKIEIKSNLEVIQEKKEKEIQKEIEIKKEIEVEKEIKVEKEIETEKKTEKATVGLGLLEKAKQAIEDWKTSQDFFTAQIAAYGRLKHLGQNHFEMNFQAPDHNMYAEMFSGRIQSQVQEVLTKALEETIRLTVSCTEKDYDEMDLVEKTAAIVGESYREKIQVTD